MGLATGVAGRPIWGAVLNMRWGREHHLWAGLLLLSAACREAVGVQPPAGSDEGLVLFQGEGGLLAYAWEQADSAGRRTYALPEVEQRLWLEYPPGTLRQFLEPGLRLIPSATADQGAPLGPLRPLPRPNKIARWSIASGWQELPIDAFELEPEVEAFRLPPLGPFACAGLGGCYPVDEPNDRSGRPTCSPCAPPETPLPPKSPNPPSFEPCPAGWSPGAVAGVQACLPPTPCDPEAEPRTGACALLDPCPGRSVDDLEAGLVVDAGDCGAPGRYCSLAEALESLGPSPSTATIALSAGDHALPGTLPERPLRLVGVCPAATRLHADQAQAILVNGPWVLSDLELSSTVGLSPSDLRLERVVIRSLQWSLDPARIELRDSVIFNGSGEIGAAEIRMEGVRVDRLSLRLAGPAQLATVALTASRLFTAGDLEVTNSQLGLASTATACESLTRGPAWRLQDVAIIGAPPFILNLGHCGLEVRRGSLRSVGGGPDGGNISLSGLGDVVMEDVVVEHQGAADTFGKFRGAITVRRLRFYGPTDQVLDLNRGQGAVFSDLDLESTATQLSTARSPEVVSLSAARLNTVERFRAVGFPSLGITIKNDVRDLPAGRGQTDLVDVEIRRCRQGGVLVTASDLSASRVQIQDSFGAGLGLQFGADARVFDLSIRGTLPLEDRCRLVSPGPPCQGTALYATLEAQVEAERFELQGTYGVALDSAAASLREGRVQADVGFQIGQTPSDLRDLLRGVQVEAQQVAEQLEVSGGQ